MFGSKFANSTTKKCTHAHTDITIMIYKPSIHEGGKKTKYEKIQTIFCLTYLMVLRKVEGAAASLDLNIYICLSGITKNSYENA